MGDETDERAELRRLLDEATPGPWETVRVDDGLFYGQSETFDIVTVDGGRKEAVVTGGPVEDGGPVLGAAEQPDADLIVALRNSAPSLLDEDAELRAENGQVWNRIDREIELRCAAEDERDAWEGIAREANRAAVRAMDERDALRAEVESARMRRDQAYAETDALRAAVEAEIRNVEAVADSDPHNTATSRAFRKVAQRFRAALAAAVPPPAGPQAPATLQEALGLTDAQMDEAQADLSGQFARIRESERRAAVDTRGLVIGDASQAPQAEAPTRRGPHTNPLVKRERATVALDGSAGPPQSPEEPSR